MAQMGEMGWMLAMLLVVVPETKMEVEGGQV